MDISSKYENPQRYSMDVQSSEAKETENSQESRLNNKSIKEIEKSITYLANKALNASEREVNSDTQREIKQLQTNQVQFEQKKLAQFFDKLGLFSPMPQQSTTSFLTSAPPGSAGAPGTVATGPANAPQARNPAVAPGSAGAPGTVATGPTIASSPAPQSNRIQNAGT